MFFEDPAVRDDGVGRSGYCEERTRHAGPIKIRPGRLSMSRDCEQARKMWID